MPETPDIPAGTQLGRYRVDGAISSGAMGAVYRAHNIVTDVDVAMKRMLGSEHAARFELEERGNPGLPVGDVIEWARQTCEALQYVHGQQIVHRDVKPQNIILGDDGIVLVDFGVATRLDATEAGTVGVGTPRFMAPEVFAGGAVSSRSDVFSLGATVWNLLTGHAPVYADDTVLAEVVPDVTP